MQTIIDFITQLLSGIVDAFKMKNPTVYTIVALVLGFFYYIAGTLEAATLPDGTSLLNEATDKLMNTAQYIVVTVLTLLGAHTVKKSSSISKSA